MNSDENMNTAVKMITHSHMTGFFFVDPEGQFNECEWKSGSQVKILHVVFIYEKKTNHFFIVPVTESTA